MAGTDAILSREELARQGDEVYQKDIQPVISAHDIGKYVLIDVATAAYEIDADELAASDRLLARRPQAQVWLRQIGTSNARRRHRPSNRHGAPGRL